MSVNLDATHQKACELGQIFGHSLYQLADRGAKVRQSLLLDLVGDDRTFLPPLRQLVDLPMFEILIAEPSLAARVAGRASLLSELEIWCNADTMALLASFLDGLLAVVGLLETGSSPHDSKDCTGLYRESRVNGVESASSVSKPTRQTDTSTSSVPDLNIDSNQQPSHAGVTDLVEKAQRCMASGHQKDAISILTTAIMIDPAQSSLYWQRASIFASVLDFGNAIQDYSALLRLDPKHLEARAQRGRALSALGEVDAAFVDLVSSAELGHQSSSSWLSSLVLDTTSAWIGQGRDQVAIQWLNTAIGLCQANPELYLNRAKAYAILEDYGSAIHDCSAAIRLDPMRSEAFALRGRFRENHGRHDGALADYKHAVSLGHKDAAAWLLAMQKNSDNHISSEASSTPSSARTSQKTSHRPKSKRGQDATPFMVAILALLCIGVGIKTNNDFLEDAKSDSNIDGKLNAARIYGKNAVLICEHQKVLDAFDRVDFRKASPSQLQEKQALLSRAKASISDLDASGRVKYREDCDVGVGMQPFDDYTWNDGGNFIGSLFAVASKKCLAPAIGINAYTDSNLSKKIHSQTISFTPDPSSGKTAKIQFIVPASSLPQRGSVWFGYDLLCKA